MTENAVETVTDTTQMATEFDASNVKEFTKALITARNKIVMYKKKITYKDDKTNAETTKENAYMYVTIGDRTLPTRANKYTIDALNEAFGTTNPAKWVNKIIVATVHEFNKQKYLVWKSEKAAD